MCAIITPDGDTEALRDEVTQGWRGAGPYFTPGSGKLQSAFSVFSTTEPMEGSRSEEREI